MFEDILKKIGETVEMDLEFENMFDLVQSGFVENFKKFSELSNHPVHFGKDPHVSSAFIPFCIYGDQVDDGKQFLSKVNDTRDTVCKHFMPKLRNDQICYEVDINKLIDKSSKGFEGGLFLALNINEDRQTLNEIEEEKNNDFYVYLNTIGMNR